MAAARTPTVYQENLGSSKLVVAKITTCVTGDTWVSGLPNVKYWWAQANKTDGTQGSSGINVSYSAGTFTIVPGIDTQTVYLFVMLNA